MATPRSFIVVTDHSGRIGQEKEGGVTRIFMV